MNPKGEEEGKTSYKQRTDKAITILKLKTPSEHTLGAVSHTLSQTSLQ